MRHLPEAIQNHLIESTIFALGTGVKNKVWVSSRRFLYENMKIYCTIKEGSRTYRNIINNPKVSFAIQGKSVLLQGEGHTKILGQIKDFPDFIKKFDEKYPDKGDQSWNVSPWVLVEIIVENLILKEWTKDYSRRETYVIEENLPPSKLKLWWRAIRPFAFPASIAPVVLGAVYANWLGLNVNWFIFPLVLIAAILYHIGTNLMNDYVDFRTKIDRPDTFGGSGVLTEGLLPSKSILNASLLSFLIGSILGLIIVYYSGILILILGIIGLLGGIFYTAKPISFKYKGLGEITVFILMGPLMVIGSFYAVTKTFSISAFYASIPIGLLTAAILTSNNIRDFFQDQQTDITTFAYKLGFKESKKFYLLLNLSAYIFVLFGILINVFPLLALLTLLTLPICIKNILRVQKFESPEDNLIGIDAQTAQLHLLFSLLLIISLIF